MARFSGSSTWASVIAIVLPALVGACAGRPNTADAPVANTTPAPEASKPAPLEPIVELPHSPLGQLARSLVDVINSGKAAEQREFIRGRFSEKALKEVSFEEWATFLERTSQLSGGVDVISVLPARGPNRLGFEVRTRNGRHYSMFAIAAAKGEDNRIDAFFARPRFDPAIVRTG